MYDNKWEYEYDLKLEYKHQRKHYVHEKIGREKKSRVVERAIYYEQEYMCLRHATYLDKKRQ